MSDKFELIKKMDSSKLIDIVKNYKRYGYEERLKDSALQILKDRGIDEETLRLTGNLSDYKFESVNEIYKSFIKSSKIAFLFYGLIFLFTFTLTSITSYSFLIILTIVYFICLISCLTFIVKSLICYHDFSKAVGKHLGSGTFIAYVLLGIFFYFFMYFYYKKEMKEDMKMIN